MVEKVIHKDAPGLKSRRGSPDSLRPAKTQHFPHIKDAHSPRNASSKPSSNVRSVRMRQWRKWVSAEIKEPIHQVAAAAAYPCNNALSTLKASPQPVAVSLSAQLKSIKDETHHVPKFSAPATSEQSGTLGEKSLKRNAHSLRDEELECSGESPHPPLVPSHDVEFVWDELVSEWSNVDLSHLDVEDHVGTSTELSEFPISNQHFAVLKNQIY